MPWHVKGGQNPAQTDSGKSFRSTVPVVVTLPAS